MTTTVTINAHCDFETTKVRVIITDVDNDVEQFWMEDKESIDCVVYDGREILVREVPK